MTEVIGPLEAPLAHGEGLEPQGLPAAKRTGVLMKPPRTGPARAQSTWMPLGRVCGPFCHVLAPSAVR